MHLFVWFLIPLYVDAYSSGVNGSNLFGVQHAKLEIHNSRHCGNSLHRMESHSYAEDNEEVVSDTANISSIFRVSKVQQLIQLHVIPRQRRFRPD